MPMTETNLQHAMRYALELGWKVLPLHTIVDGKCDCNRQGCTSPGKHPRIQHGRTDASDDVETIQRWWSMWPDANIGVATGPESGIIVIDIDGEDGEKSLEGKYMPSTIEQYTGSGGRHLIYKHPGYKVKNKANVLHKVDSRADGGYIVVAPSNHISGGEYEWRIAPFGTDMLDAPHWWLAELEDKSKRINQTSETGQVQTGGRNDYLASFAGKLNRDGFDYDEILSALLIHNKKKCSPPLDEYEVTMIAKSISRYAQFTDEEIEMQRRGAIIAENIMKKFEERQTKLIKDRIRTEIKPPEVYMPDNGIIKMISDWINETSIFPQPYLAMAAASTFFSVICGRKYEGHSALRPNLYMIGLAGSGCGKDHARKCISKLASACGLDSIIGGDRIASGSALVSALTDSSVLYYQLDEFGLLLQGMTDQKASSHKRELMDIMMQVYTSSGGEFRGTDYADRKLKERKVIKNPILSIYGTSTHGSFYDALGQSHAENGALARMLVIDAGDDRPQRVRTRISQPPAMLVEIIKEFVDADGIMNYTGPDMDVESHIIPMQPGVDDAWHELDDEMIKLGKKIGYQAIYARALEQIGKLSLLFAVSQGQKEIDLQTYQIARDVVLWGIESLVDAMNRHVSDNENEKKVKKVEAIIRDAGKDGISKGLVLKKTRTLSRWERDQILQDLEESMDIMRTIADSAKRPTTVFIHRDYFR